MQGLVRKRSADIEIKILNGQQKRKNIILSRELLYISILLILGLRSRRRHFGTLAACLLSGHDPSLLRKAFILCLVTFNFLNVL